MRDCLHGGQSRQGRDIRRFKMKILITILILMALPLCAVAQRVDLHNPIEAIVGFAPVVETGNNAHSTGVIDTSRYSGIEFYFITGTLADSNAVFTVSVAGGDVVDSTGTTITDSAAITTASEFIGSITDASFQYDDDNEIHKLGYVGSKKYIKVTVTPSGNSGNAPIACMAIGRLRVAP